MRVPHRAVSPSGPPPECPPRGEVAPRKRRRSRATTRPAALRAVERCGAPLLHDGAMSDASTDRRGSTRSRGRSAVRWVAALAVLAWLAIGGVGGPLVGRLSEVATNDNANFLPPSAESTSVSKLVARTTDTQTLPYLVVVERPSGLTPADLGAVQAWVAGIPGLKLSDPTRTVGECLQAPPTAAIPSQDKQGALVPVACLADKAEVTIGGDTALYAVAQALRESAASTLGASGLTVHVTGAGGFFADFIIAFSGIDGILLLVALGVVFVILLVVYRSPILPFAVLITAVFGLDLAALAIFPLARDEVIGLSGQSQGILSILVVGAATDYALLLVSRYKEELHDHDSTWVAMKRAWRGAVEPIVASGATVILGLLCLLLSDLGNTSGLGPVGAIGIAGALVSALTFLPAVLLLFGRSIFWPAIPRLDHVHAQDKIGTRGLWGRVASMVGEHPRQIGR